MARRVKGEDMGDNRKYSTENGELLGDRYLIKEQLGRGSNGSVYLCYDIKLQKEWAVKEIKEPYDIERSMEMELLKTISSNSFPRIVDIIKHNGCIFVVMDYIKGITLTERMKKQILTEIDVIPWAMEIAKGIQYLHQMRPSILYMDCKPDNIMLTQEGEIRLVDLGSAYICIKDKEQRISGTKYFAPLEQRKAGLEEVPDVRTDIYAFGMTLYYLLTGGKKEWRRKGKLCVKEIIPSVSWGMSHIIEKCTMENPKYRYQSMEEVIDQLGHIRTLGKWKAGKVRMNQAVSLLMKAGCAGMILLLVLQYRMHGNPIWVFMGLLFFGGLLVTVFGKQITMYEMNRDIFCGSGKRVLYILIAVIGLMGFWCIKSYAANEKLGQELNGVEENGSGEVELNIILYDKLGRKILIKDGTSWGVDEDIIMVIPIEEISGDEGEIQIRYMVKGEEKEYTYKCSRK